MIKTINSLQKRYSHQKLNYTFTIISFISQQQSECAIATINKCMDHTYEDIEKTIGQPKKKVKLDPATKDQLKEKWSKANIKKKIPLTASISDYNRTNRFRSHKGLQNYLRYLLTQTIPNPMWLLIKRQSNIEQIIYIDLQIEGNLFEQMIRNKEITFLSSMINQTNTALFKGNDKIYRQNLWEKLLCYEDEQKIEDIGNANIIKEQLQLNEQLYLKYAKYMLTPEQLSLHCYPNQQLPLYKDYYLPSHYLHNTPPLKDTILVVDCEMVSSINGFQLARATIMNFTGEILFDELFKPDIEIINYNTQYSGITQEILRPVTNTVQNKLYPFLETILCDQTILVGHSLQNDLRAMKLIHKKVIDSSILFMRKNGAKLKLKSLSQKILKRQIQVSEHDSIEDCLATLHLIRAKIEHDQIKKDISYDLLKEMIACNKKAVFVDYALDQQMKATNTYILQNIPPREKSEVVFGAVKKYLQEDAVEADFIATRIQRPTEIEWRDYYKQFDESFQQFYNSLPKMTLIFLNCQINPKEERQLVQSSFKSLNNGRSPCYILTV